MKERNITKEIQNASQKATIKPSDAVWMKLSKELDSGHKKERKSILNLHFLQVAASVIILLSAAIFIFLSQGKSNIQNIIQLEDLHSLEINTENNLPNAGDAMTVPALLDAKAIFTSDKIIEEGSSEQRLIPRDEVDNDGLG